MFHIIELESKGKGEFLKITKNKSSLDSQI